MARQDRRVKKKWQLVDSEVGEFLGVLGDKSSWRVLGE